MIAASETLPVRKHGVASWILHGFAHTPADAPLSVEQDPPGPGPRGSLWELYMAQPQPAKTTRGLSGGGSQRFRTHWGYGTQLGCASPVQRRSRVNRSLARPGRRSTNPSASRPPLHGPRCISIGWKAQCPRLLRPKAEVAPESICGRFPAAIQEAPRHCFSWPGSQMKKNQRKGQPSPVEFPTKTDRSYGTLHEDSLNLCEVNSTLIQKNNVLKHID